MRPILLVLIAGCAPPDRLMFTSQFGVASHDGPEGVTSAFVDLFDGAEETLRVALPAGEDLALSDAIVAAQGRGVEVEVVTDVDRADEPVFVALATAGVPLSLADDAFVYFDFGASDELGWESEDVRMKQAFAVADRTRYVAATSVGSNATGTRIVFSGHDEELGEDLSFEHVQMFGGTDATAVNAYEASSKSITERRWSYGTSTDARVELWFNPQERVGKRAIDAVLSARHSVRVLTDDLTSEGLIQAAQWKANDGFDVEIVVGPNFGSSFSLLSGMLEDDTPDVVKLQVANGDELIPTIVIIDVEGGNDTSRRALVSTHDLYSAPRLYRGLPVVNDQLIDGTLFVIEDWSNDPSDAMQPILDTYEYYASTAGNL